LQLLDVSFRVGSETWLYPLSLTLAEGRINVLLGATRAGKTTLLRILAGLERPSTGRLLSRDRDLTGVPVRQRNVAMVYQQFINYPTFTVFENIASPLRVAGMPAPEVRSRVVALAEMLRLSPLLSRYPAELSGGQQQRVALARALAKEAELLLLDEPLVNLDYKLREELRDELEQIFAQRRTTVVYATTEPQEALQLGGHTHLLSEGRLLQSGPTLEVFRRPATLEAARAFSDPPLNLIPGRIDLPGGTVQLIDGSTLHLPPRLLARLPDSVDDEVILGVRPHQVTLAPRQGAQCCLNGQIQLAEISGSESYVHVSGAGVSLTALVPGVHRLVLGEPCALYFDPADLYCFDRHGSLLLAAES
jgi:glycerol transport system ATP-binding protein